MAGDAVSIGSSEDGVTTRIVAGADRFHNQSLQSPESLANTVEDLEAAVKALETRLANVSAGLSYQLQSVEERADHATRRLGLEVVEMGEALSRRIRAQPTPAAIAPVAVQLHGLINPVTIGLSGALLAALAALGWLLSHNPTAAVTGIPRSAPAVAALYAPSNEAEPVIAPKPTHVAVRRRSHFAAHRSARVKHASPPPPAPLPDTLPGSGAHSVLGPSPG